MLTARACNLALDGSAPDWIQLLPVGPAIQGIDGRAWTLPDPHALVTAFAARNKPLVVDWEHASEHRAPLGLDAPAAGWIDQIEVRAGAIYGHVEWTPKAAQQIADREYRFLSPVFVYQKNDLRIVELDSVGLTNKPNLNLTALNREESPVTLPVDLCKALDLPDTANEALALARIQTLNLALNTAQALAAAPPLDKFIPRADYDAACARASNAETRLKEVETGQQNQAIEAALTTALRAGQICPATVEFYRAGCQRDGGLAAFTEFLKAAPPVLGAKPDLDGKKPNAPATAATLTPEQKAVCSAMGIDPALYAKNLETPA